MTATDKNPTTQHQSVPASGGEAAVADVEFAYVSRALWVGGAGTLAVTMQDGTDLSFQGVAAGTLLPIRAKKVKGSSTASLIVAIY